MIREVKLGEILEYEQPNMYIVKNTNYNKKFDTPVLTAGQSFILGYTNEKENIFKAKENPVIIFDDFTTASKYVDFDFKVKSSAMKILKSREGINIKYVYYAMQNIKFDNQLHKRYWISEYSKIKLLIPDIKIQEKIVKELDLVIKVLDYKKKQIKLFDELIKSQFVEMFGNIKNSIKLGECCSINARIGWQSLTKKEHMETGEYILVTGTDFRNNEIDYTKCVYVSKERYEMDKKIILKNDDILITKDGTIGKVAVVKNLIKPATLNSGIFVVRPNNIFNKEYIMYVFKGHIFKEFVNKAKTGATIKHLNQNKLINFEIPKPSMEEQIEFSNIYKQIDKQKFEIEKSLKETQELYESLMEKYFG